jgi:hypothetical protein
VMSYLICVLCTECRGEIKKDEVGEICSTHAGDEKCLLNFGLMVCRRIPPGRYSCRRKDDIKIVLK